MTRRDWEVVYDALQRRLADEVDEGEGVSYAEIEAAAERVAERLR